MKIGDLCPERSKRSACGEAAAVNEDGCTGNPAREEHPRGRYAACAQSVTPVDIVSVRLQKMTAGLISTYYREWDQKSRVGCPG